MAKKGLVTKGDGKEVHHVGGIDSNKLTVSDKSKNRGKKNEGGRKKGVGHNYPKKRKYVNKRKKDKAAGDESKHCCP
jgi:hypothetical protein